MAEWSLNTDSHNLRIISRAEPLYRKGQMSPMPSIRVSRSGRAFQELQSQFTQGAPCWGWLTHIAQNPNVVGEHCVKVLFCWTYLFSETAPFLVKLGGGGPHKWGPALLLPPACDRSGGASKV